MDTQRDRALRLYRRLLVLERVFRNTNGTHHEQETSASEDSLREGIQSMLAELAEDARIVSTVPHPRSDRPQGDDATASRFSTGSSDGPLGTAQECRAPSHSSRRS